MTKLLTVTDLAARLVLPKSTVYELCRRVEDPIPHLRLGRHIRFQPDQVDRWLERQQNGRNP